MRVGIVSAMALACAVAVGSCVDNEVTLFVEHMKVQPTPPSCVTTTGDEMAANGLIDLAWGMTFGGWYYVTNHAMIREEYDNLRAETDGIFIDGMETHVTTANGDLIGGSEDYQFELYIPPQSSAVVPAVALPYSVVVQLAQHNGCPSIRSSSVQTEYEQAIIDGSLDQVLVQDWYEAVYTKVRFIGHTQGGSEVQTSEFSFLIDLCCNCLIDWSPCNNSCYAFCSEPTDSPFCNPGVMNSSGSMEDCASFFYSPKKTWQGTDLYGNPQEQGCDLTCTSLD